MSNYLEPMLKMVKSNPSKVVAISTILAGLAIGYSMMRQKPSKKKPVETVEPSMAPALTEQQVVAVMNAIMDRVKSLTCTTMHNAKKIKNDIEAQGHQVDNETLRQTYILPNFERGYMEIQTFIFSEFDVDETEVEEAATYYRKAGNIELKKIHDGIRKVFKMFGGDLDDEAEAEEGKEDETGDNDYDDEDDDDDYEDIEDDDDEDVSVSLTEEDVLSILEILAQKMVGHTINFAEEFKRKYGLPNSSPDLMDAFLQGITTLSEEAEKLVLLQSNFTMEEFQGAFHACKMKGSPAIDNAVKKMKVDNQALLRSQGIVI